MSRWQLGVFLIALSLLDVLCVAPASAEAVFFEQPWVIHGGPLWVSANRRFLWVPVNEYSYWLPTLNLTLIQRVAQGIHDAYGNGDELIMWHPGTPHGSSSLHFHDDALTDFNGQQTRYRYREIPAFTTADWRRRPLKPVANLEADPEAPQGAGIHSG